jgi:protein-S-isoprenylcysteine O-methyltransferase Ste14
MSFLSRLFTTDYGRDGPESYDPKRPMLSFLRSVFLFIGVFAVFKEMMSLFNPSWTKSIGGFIWWGCLGAVVWWGDTFRYKHWLLNQRETDYSRAEPEGTRS